ncbi:MAG: tRNA dihydrouridine synthase DusB [Treponema sp.]|nr:tRNA dihydrouridine synthase DusB [Treponema sp.]
MNIGPLSLSRNRFLAPVAGYTDRAFRSLCAEQGASLCFTELVSAEAIVRNPEMYVSETVHPLLRKGIQEKFLAVQLFGSSAETLGNAVRILAPLKPDLVDLNAGCPVPKVVKNGAGAALMKNPAAMARIVEAMVKSSEAFLGGVPVTVKMRSGWDAASLTYAECARAAADMGAAMVTLHPRTRSQAYGGKSEWAHIASLAALAVPVCGSGDLYTMQDARDMLKNTGCAAVMFARGALGNPFIFNENPPPDVEHARLKAGLRHLELLAADIGERAACLEMRKQFCAYTKGSAALPGIAGGAALRDKLVHAQTIAEYVSIIDGVT